MKKKIINRGLLGFPLGIAIGYIVSILVSLYAGDGMFHFAKPELVEKVGSELNAVILQTVCREYWEQDLQCLPSYGK